MAKKSARGRYTICEMVRETTAPDLVFPDKGTVTTIHHRALMSDRKVLERETSKDNYANWMGEYETRSGTWRIRGKLKAELTPVQWEELYTAKGWSKVANPR